MTVSRPTGARWKDLTPREQEVLLKLSRGLSNKIIAHELGISPATVQVHVSNIMQKVGALNRTELSFLVNSGSLSLEAKGSLQ